MLTNIQGIQGQCVAKIPPKHLPKLFPVSEPPSGANLTTRATNTLTSILQWKPLDGMQIPTQPLAAEKIPPLKVTFGGGGIFFWWEIGAVLWLSENFDLGKVSVAGASSGALAAVLAACKVDPYETLYVAQRLSDEYGVYERPLGLIGVWGEIIRIWLNELLPDNAAELCRNRVEVVVTDVPSFQLRSISDFESKADLIDVVMGSAHVPFVLDGNPAASVRGNFCIDGSFQDFLNCNNSRFLTCNGKAVLFDYFQDEDLQFKRFDFLSLKKYDEVVDLMTSGYKFAEKKGMNGSFDGFNTSLCALPSNQFNSLFQFFRNINFEVPYA